MARQLRVRESGTVFSARSDAHLVCAPGVLGGSPSGVTRIIRNPGANRAEILHSKASGLVLAAGETVRIETLAGGGYSPPAERALEHLAADLREGKVTRAAAERDYGAERVALALRLPTA
jgi:N-methylhydantoinase B